MRLHNLNKRRGFALVAAIGVMVLVGIFAFAAATTAQFTYAFSQARFSDQQLGRILREAAVAEMASPQPASADQKRPVITTETAAGNNVVVTAAELPGQQGLQMLGGALKPREGDQVLELRAMHRDKFVRGANYLVNRSGNRTAPILLREVRP